MKTAVSKACTATLLSVKPNRLGHLMNRWKGNVYRTPAAPPRSPAVLLKIKFTQTVVQKSQAAEAEWEEDEGNVRTQPCKACVGIHPTNLGS